MTDAARHDSEERPTPPEVATASFKREWPFIEFELEHEQRDDHALMAGVTACAATAAVFAGGLPVWAGVPLAFISGYALNNWLVYDDLYLEEVEA